jgi:thiosulfate/3-mercaptopyruvate sulfurtransferase
MPAQQLLDPATWRFRPSGELAQVLSDLVEVESSVPVIAYCGGGISATVDVFALSMLGCNDVRLYDGSLTEWSADPNLALKVG